MPRRKKQLIYKDFNSKFKELSDIYIENEENDDNINALNKLDTIDRNLMILYIISDNKYTIMAKKLNCCTAVVKRKIDEIRDKIIELKKEDDV